jgi:glycine/D-amino acid oxidase-like deaminating enzyme
LRRHSSFFPAVQLTRVCGQIHAQRKASKVAAKRAARKWSEVCFDALRPVLCATPPDSNVVIDVYPDNDRSIIVSPCLGPGFKHSAPIGEALAEQIIDSTSKVDISSFSLKSFRDLIQ